MKFTYMSAAAFAAVPLVLGNPSPLATKNSSSSTTTTNTASTNTASTKLFMLPMPLNATGSTPFKSLMPPFVKFSGEVADCRPICEQWRHLNHCVSGGWQNNCAETCMGSCILLDEHDTDSPSESDLIHIISEESDWQGYDPRRVHPNSGGNERTEIPCLGWCKRGVMPVEAEAAVDAAVEDMLGRVTAYAQVYHHLRALDSSSPSTSSSTSSSSISSSSSPPPYIAPIGTRLDPFLKTWIAGFKGKLAQREDLDEWYSSLYKHVEQQAGGDGGPAGQVWAYRFELVAAKDNERELEELVVEVPKKKRVGVVRAVHGAWKEEFNKVQGPGGVVDTQWAG